MSEAFSSPLNLLKKILTPEFWSILLKEMSYVHNFSYCLGPPRIMEIETTNRCAGHCIMCPKTYNFHRKTQDMDFTLFKIIISQVKPYYQKKTPLGLPELPLFHYGSPFLYPYFGEAISLCKKKGFYIIFSDIAAIMDSDKCREIVSSQLDEVWLMVDGINNETTQYIRGPAASFDKAVENIKALLKIKNEKQIDYPKIKVIMIRQPANYYQAESFLQFFSRIDGISGSVAFFSSFGGDIPEINQLLADLQKITGQPDEDLRVKENNSFRCYYPWNSVSILSDGRVVPCCRDMNGTIILGDLNKQTLKEIWNGEPIKKLRREFISGKITNPLCINCKEANNEIGLPNSVYPLFKILTYLSPSSFKNENSDIN